MAVLPTTGLTLHLDASDTDHLFTTFVLGGPHTGVPGDGATVQAWTSEEGVDRLFKQLLTSGLPVYRTTTPLMRRPCLDFTGGQRMLLTNATDNSQVLSTIIAPTAFTLLVAFYAETIVSTALPLYVTPPLICDSGSYWGAFVHLVGGLPKVSAFNWDTAAAYVTLPVTVGASHVLLVRHSAGVLSAALDGGPETTTPSGTTGGLAGQVNLAMQGESYDGRLGEIAVYNTALTGTPLTDAVTYFTEKWLAPATPPAVVGELDRRTLTSATGTLNATWTGTAIGNWTAGLVALKKT